MSDILKRLMGLINLIIGSDIEQEFLAIRQRLLRDHQFTFSRPVCREYVLVQARDFQNQVPVSVDLSRQKRPLAMEGFRRDRTYHHRRQDYRARQGTRLRPWIFGTCGTCIGRYLWTMNF